MIKKIIAIIMAEVINIAGTQSEWLYCRAIGVIYPKEIWITCFIISTVVMAIFGVVTLKWIETFKD